MGHAQLPLAVVTARGLANSLEDIADRLGRAGTAAEFVAVVEENYEVWENIRSAAGSYGWSLPRRLLEFSLNSSARARQGLSDHDVEVMISINRSISLAILGGR
jgi:hypothetical protein